MSSEHSAPRRERPRDGLGTWRAGGRSRPTRRHQPVQELPLRILPNSSRAWSAATSASQEWHGQALRHADDHHLHSCGSGDVLLGVARRGRRGNVPSLDELGDSAPPSRAPFSPDREHSSGFTGSRPLKRLMRRHALWLRFWAKSVRCASRRLGTSRQSVLRDWLLPFLFGR